MTRAGRIGGTFASLVGAFTEDCESLDSQGGDCLALLAGSNSVEPSRSA